MPKTSSKLVLSPVDLDCLARALLRNGNLPIERVVHGSVHSLRASHICA